MIIVPIGKVRLQVAETEKREEYIREFNDGLKNAAQEIVKRCIEAEITNIIIHRQGKS